MPCPDFMMIFTGLGREKWKMRAHEKKHKKYQCDKCDRSFEYQYIFKKHKLVNHEDTKLYCHFFNNKKLVPIMTNAFSCMQIQNSVGMI